MDYRYRIIRIHIREQEKYFCCSKTKKWYNVINTKEKQATAKQAFVFLVFITSKGPLKTDEERGKRVFASEAGEEKQATAKQAFVFLVFITSKGPLKTDEERGKRVFASEAGEEKQATAKQAFVFLAFITRGMGFMGGQEKKEKAEKRTGAKSLRVDILVLSLLPICILGSEIIAVIYTFLNKRVDSSFFRKIINQVYIFTGCTIVITFIIVIIMVSRIIAALKRLANILTAMADGDLTQKIDEKDLRRRNELGSIARSADLLNHKLTELVSQFTGAADMLNESVVNMERIADSTAQAADHVTSNMQEITKELGDQSQQTENVAADVEQIGRMIEQSSDTLNGLRTDMEMIKGSGAEGMNTVSRLEKVDEDVSTRMEVIVRQTNTTNSSAQQIRAATELIASIAEETNLLALNASIEAARAGEQGRGFAVVADQIQKLAEQSNHSAAAIDKVVQELLEDAGNAVATMDEIQGSIQKQNETVAEVKNVFSKLNEEILHSVRSIDAIAESMTELNGSKNGLVEASEQLNAISQNSLAVTEETTAEAEELDSSITIINESSTKLRECADELIMYIKFFKTNENYQ